jgi:hypothetical protein
MSRSGSMRQQIQFPLRRHFSSRSLLTPVSGSQQRGASNSIRSPYSGACLALVVADGSAAMTPNRQPV